MSVDKKIRLFYSYSHKDEGFRTQLEEHLHILKRNGLVDSWTDRMISPGDDWKNAIDENLSTADVILLLISSSFIASEYCYEKELQIAMARYEAGQARIIPIFLRPCDWKDTPFASIQGLPKDAVPISTWPDIDTAWLDVAQGVRSVLSELKEIKQRALASNHVQSLQHVLATDLNGLDSFYGKDSSVSIAGISTGLSDVDRLLNGLQPGQLVVVASRPLMGKTAICLNIATSIAENMPVLIFSTKLSAQDVSRRITSALGLVNYERIARGYATDDDWPRLVNAIEKMQELNLTIDDRPTLTISDLTQTCIAEKKKSGALGLILIDSAEYLFESEQTEGLHGALGRSLKILARDLNVPIIVTCHVPRIVEQRINKRPLLGDLNDSYGLGEESDIVLFVYLDSFYNPDSPDVGTGELIIAKNRSGPIGAVRLSHYPQYATFQSFIGNPSS